MNTSRRRLKPSELLTSYNTYLGKITIKFLLGQYCMGFCFSSSKFRRHRCEYIYFSTCIDSNDNRSQNSDSHEGVTWAACRLRNDRTYRSRHTWMARIGQPSSEPTRTSGSRKNAYFGKKKFNRYGIKFK